MTQAQAKSNFTDILSTNTCFLAVLGKFYTKNPGRGKLPQPGNFRFPHLFFIIDCVRKRLKIHKINCLRQGYLFVAKQAVSCFNFKVSFTHGQRILGP
jgi:hypothetical protein